ADARFNPQQISALAGAAQQHTSIYWSPSASQTLHHLDPKLTLASQMQHCFAATETPTWQDASTTTECRELEQRLGGPQRLARLTGSRAYERFTINQIAKLYKRDPDRYHQCHRISLASSFLGSLFLGNFMPIDYADGSGMNLLDLDRRSWAIEVIDAVADRSLLEKLGAALGPAKTTSSSLVASQTTTGMVHSYWTQRYQLSSDCQVLAFTGDNPASLLGLPARTGDLFVSLGTSDTAFFTSETKRAGLDGHVLCHPLDPGRAYMTLLCIKNGSLTREWVRDQYCQGSWDRFNHALAHTSPGCESFVGCYLRVPEILPHAQGIQRFSASLVQADGTWQFTPVPEFPQPRWNIRALVEFQAFTMKHYVSQKGLDTPSRVVAMGGAAANDAILQVWADVFNCPIHRVQPETSAAMGCAMRAAFAMQLPHLESSSIPQYAEFLEASGITVFPWVMPNPLAVKTYQALWPRFTQFLQLVTDQFGY
ncbi:hypothetical protein H4R35_005241, partial [Dimargaris xerosporica]